MKQLSFPDGMRSCHFQKFGLFRISRLSAVMARILTSWDTFLEARWIRRCSDLCQGNIHSCSCRRRVFGSQRYQSFEPTANRRIWWTLRQIWPWRAPGSWQWRPCDCDRSRFLRSIQCKFRHWNSHRLFYFESSSERPYLHTDLLSSGRPGRSAKEVEMDVSVTQGALLLWYPGMSF